MSRYLVERMTPANVQEWVVRDSSTAQLTIMSTHGEIKSQANRVCAALNAWDETLEQEAIEFRKKFEGIESVWKIAINGLIDHDRDDLWEKIRRQMENT